MLERARQIAQALAVALTVACCVYAGWMLPRERPIPSTYQDDAFQLTVVSYESPEGLAAGTVRAVNDCGDVMIWGHTFDGPNVAYQLGPVAANSEVRWSGHLLGANGKPLPAGFYRPWWYSVTCGGDFTTPRPDWA